MFYWRNIEVVFHDKCIELTVFVDYLTIPVFSYYTKKQLLLIFLHTK